MRTMKLLIAGGIATTTLLAGTAVTASAQSTTIKDKRADVVSYDSADDSNGTVLNRADSIASGIDVTSMDVKHSKKSLKVTIKFAKLAKTTPLISSEIKAKVGKKTVRYYAMNMESSKRIAVYNGSSMKQLCSVKLSKKTGTKGSLSYTIPRSCLKKPKSLQINAGIIDSIDSILSGEGSFLTDAISKSRTRDLSWTKSLKPS